MDWKRMLRKKNFKKKKDFHNQQKKIMKVFSLKKYWNVFMTLKLYKTNNLRGLKSKKQDTLCYKVR